MTLRMRRLRYVAAAFCVVVAQTAFTVPARVPEPPVAQDVAPAEVAPGTLAPEAGRQRADPSDTLARDAAMGGAATGLIALDSGRGTRGGEDTRVAEPSTLVLVSVGLFALILWNRRRR